MRGSDRGLTVLEVVLLLAISVAMIGALLPTLSSTITHTEQTRATTDMTNIKNQLLQALADLNYAKFSIDGTKGGTAVNLLVSDGDIPRELSGAGSASWQPVVDNTTGLTDFLERHLVTNNPRGSAANAYPTGGGNPWRGAYLTAPIDPDPWGNRYMVNSQFFGPSTNDVVVYSAGPNEIIETAFAANPLAAAGDDLIVLVEA